jgi:hypothetical protein
MCWSFGELELVETEVAWNRLKKGGRWVAASMVYSQDYVMRHRACPRQTTIYLASITGVTRTTYRDEHLPQ